MHFSGKHHGPPGLILGDVPLNIEDHMRSIEQIEKKVDGGLARSLINMYSTNIQEEHRSLWKRNTPSILPHAEPIQEQTLLNFLVILHPQEGGNHAPELGLVYLYRHVSPDIRYRLKIILTQLDVINIDDRDLIIDALS